MRAVGVLIDVNLCAAKAAAIDDAGVIFGIAKDGIARASERGNRADVGGIAGGEEECGSGAFKGGEFLF